jgi:hypothetical protein
VGVGVSVLWEEFTSLLSWITFCYLQMVAPTVSFSHVFQTIFRKGSSTRD